MNFSERCPFYKCNESDETERSKTTALTLIGPVIGAGFRQIPGCPGGAPTSGAASLTSFAFVA
jgi:hypothetical protein